MITNQQFSHQITTIVFSSAPRRQKVKEVADRLRQLLSAPRHIVETELSGFDPSLFDCNAPPKAANEERSHAHEDCADGPGPENGVCPHSGLPCMVKVTHPQSFFAGQFLGHRIKEAERGNLSRVEFEKALVDFFSGEKQFKDINPSCEPKDRKL